MNSRWLTLLCLTAWLWGCAKTPALEQLLERVDTLQQAVENKQIDTAMGFLTQDFKTGEHSTGTDTRRMLLFYSIRHDNIHILRSNIEAALDEVYLDQAYVNFNALVTGGHGLLPDEGQSYRVSSRWLFLDGDWYLDRLDWKPLL